MSSLWTTVMDGVVVSAAAACVGWILYTRMQIAPTRSVEEAATAAGLAGLSARALVTEQEVLGDMTHLLMEASSVTVRGLRVATFRYSSSTNYNKPAIVAIHGGPGFTHHYISPLKLLCDEGHPVIFYDQAGCGASSWVENVEFNAPHLLSIDYYVEELHAVLRHHGLHAQPFYLFGSSWGTVVAQEYAVQMQEQYRGWLRGVILDGVLSDAQTYIQTQRRDNWSKLPSFSEKLLRKIVHEGAVDTPIYKEFDETMGKMFTCRLIPRPDFFLRCFESFNKEIYVKMQGASEFEARGVLEHWTILPRLHRIECPVLVLRGEFDSMTEECSQQIIDRVKSAWPLVTIPRAGHCKLVDEPHATCAAIVKFLACVEISAKSGATTLPAVDL